MKKSKFLTTLAVATASITPVVFSVGCHKNNYDPLTADFKQQAIQEFIDVVKTPHGSGHTKQMYEHLESYLKPYIVPGSWYQDGYRAKGSENDSSGNICFDIKPSAGCEDWPGITLQGHYDMVIDGTADKGVDAVVDGHIMHSKNHQSSLGADDGIGLGIIITIIKNQDKFNHGPLHILLTSDEESDTSGANTIPTDEYDMVKYHNVINIDAEADKKITVSCASTYSTTFTLTFADDDFTDISYTDSKLTAYRINISGLLGGHSANCINEGRLSAIKVMANLLSKLNNNNDLNIISIDAPNKSNAICKEADVLLYIKDLDVENVKEYVIKPLINNYKKTNPIEKDLKIDISEEIIKSSLFGSPKKMLNDQGSTKLYSYLKNMPFGPFEWIKDDLKEVATSNNIGDVCFQYQPNSKDLTLKSFSRSCIVGHDAAVCEIAKERAIKIFGKDNVKYSDPETSPTWAYKPTNELFDLFSDGYKTVGITPERRNAHSWLECAYFCQKQEHVNDRLIAVGPLITDAHSVKETLYLDTLDPLISSLLYTLRNGNKLPK